MEKTYQILTLNIFRKIPSIHTASHFVKTYTTNYYTNQQKRMTTYTNVHPTITQTVTVVG